MKFDHGFNPTNLIGETITAAKIVKSQEGYSDEDVLQLILGGGEIVHIRATYGGYSHTERAIDEYPCYVVLEFAENAK